MQRDPEIILAIVVCLSLASIALALTVSPVAGIITAGSALYLASTI